MNLLNHTLKYLAFALLGIISVWAVIFYVNMLDEVYDSLDDGLDNYKMLIIEKAHADPATLRKTEFAEGNYEIREIDPGRAKHMKDVHKDTLMYMPYEQDMEPVRILTTSFHIDDKYYELKIISSMVEEDDLIEDLLYALIWLYVALVVSILVVNNLLLRKIWKPFYHLVGQLKSFRLGRNQQLNPAATNVKEFKVLNESVAALVQHALDTYNSQKQFIENASHELQTPVAISINRLELLVEKSGMTEADLETVGNVIQTLERLSRLNKSLLLLSKIENRQFEKAEPVSINSVVADLKEEFADFAAYKLVAVNVAGDASVDVIMQKDLTVIMISNLLKNAIVHNHTNGFVQLLLSENSLSIANSGANAPLDGQRIFQRFHKSAAGNSHTGLGLAIVKAIADLYGFKVTYAFDGRHIMHIDFRMQQDN
ncbi:MAG: HAMP domain-containing histidine kinase [Dyadobacter sp.]|uniref:sensor histidine kinase n=1 Tax=Dyadobacter sp. TaxID=1914288 RepID=UPI001B0E929F|nr:HAMP domain-containing sensor histidine kinase [Dyadobacter sp.]MBO9616522.1 HAMP domain-containing histidine kinase [Dyadobacter sp.]